MDWHLPHHATTPALFQDQYEMIFIKATTKLSTPFKSYSLVLNKKLLGRPDVVWLGAGVRSTPDQRLLVTCRAGRAAEAGRQITVTVFSGSPCQDDSVGRRRIETTKSPCSSTAAAKSSAVGGNGSSLIVSLVGRPGAPDCFPSHLGAN